jgi:hypothetical protein
MTASLDRGELDRRTAILSFRQAVALFNQSINTADAQLAEQSRRNFFDGLATLAAVVAEQDRQRAATVAARRPVICTSTGVYVQNTVVCN